jgi:CRP-like cAMP-binding protein
MIPSKPNRLLASLSASAHDLLVNSLVSVDLPLKKSLYKPEKTPAYVYFLTSGMASIVSSTGDGGSAEVGVIGFEGMVGGLHMLGPARVPTDSFMQLEGAGLRAPFENVKRAFRDSEEFRDRVLEFYQEQSVVVAQLAACNRLHNAEERLARWLLMAADCTESNPLFFTQEFLAMMLGSRRTTVTLVAGALQKADLITYARGAVTIVNREQLESAACDCYGIIKKLRESLYGS